MRRLGVRLGFVVLSLLVVVWIIPAARMKAGREHRVPLSGPAAGVIRRLKKLRVGEFVFPGQKLTRPLSNMAMLKVLERMDRAELTVHGFRSTFRDWAAEQINTPSEVAEMALAHTVADKVEAAYRRGDLFEKRRELMEDWARFSVGINGRGRASTSKGTNKVTSAIPFH